MRRLITIVAGLAAGMLYAVRRAGWDVPRIESYRVPPSWRPQSDGHRTRRTTW